MEKPPVTENLEQGTVSACISKYDKAREYIQTLQVIRKVIRDREGEAWCYVKIRVLYQSVGEYYKAKIFGERIGDHKKNQYQI